LDLLAVEMANGTATIEQQGQFIDEVSRLIVSVIEKHGFDFPRVQRDDVIMDVIEDQVMPGLKKYKIEKGKYSNWVTWGARLYLMYRHRPRMMKLLTNEKLIDDIIGKSNHDADASGDMIDSCDHISEIAFEFQAQSPRHFSDIEIRDSVAKLFRMYPKHYEFLRAMYGDVNKKGWELHIASSVSEAVNASCSNYNESARFYDSIVVPYFKKMLVGN